MPVKKLKRDYHKDPFEHTYLTCYNYNDQCLPRENITIAAFDPGVVNTGLRIEDRKIEEDGSTKVDTIEQQLIISDKKGDCQHFYVKMRNKIYELKEKLKKCDYILIESQMPNNPQAIRMCQHIISTLLSFLADSNTLVIEILPTVKSRAFGLKGVRGKDLKKWAVEKAIDILQERNDDTGLKLLQSSKKKDDQSDVVLYCESWSRFLKCGEFKESE